MGAFEKLYTKTVLEPLANFLIERNASKPVESGVYPISSDPIINKASASGYQVRDQYMAGQNYLQVGTQRTKPGSGVDFEVLRRFSVQYDVARACINRRKRQLNQLQWDIVSEDPDVKIDQNAARELKAQFKTLGGYRVRFRSMLDMMVEDLLVLDALAIYKRPTLGAELHSLKVIDGATIRLRVDKSGDTPEPPEIAYKQVIRGEVVAEFTSDEMYYEMMNPRTQTPYGLGPIESMILGVSTALKSEVYNMHMLTEGNIPEGLYSMPDTWSSDQIKQFQAIWDAMLAGNSKANSKIKFVPPGKYERTTKPEDMRYKELQEWLMKKCCMMFEIQPQDLGFTETVNRSTGQTQQEIGHENGLIPLAHFFEEIFSDVVQIDMGHPEMKFKFLGLDDENERQVAEVNEILIRSGQRTPNEVRKQDGLDEVKDTPGADRLWIGSNTQQLQTQEEIDTAAETAAAIASSANDPSSNEDDPNAEDDPKAADDKNKTAKAAGAQEAHIELVTELRTFRKYAVNRIKAGKELRKFTSEVLPASTVDEINTRLSKAANADDARAVFKDFMQDYQVEFLANVAELRGTLNKVI